MQRQKLKGPSMYFGDAWMTRHRLRRPEGGRGQAIEQAAGSSSMGSTTDEPPGSPVPHG